MQLALHLTEEWIERHQDVAWDSERSKAPKPFDDGFLLHTTLFHLSSSLIAKSLIIYTVWSLKSGLFSSNSAPWNTSSDFPFTTSAGLLLLPNLLSFSGSSVSVNHPSSKHFCFGRILYPYPVTVFSSLSNPGSSFVPNWNPFLNQF